MTTEEKTDTLRPFTFRVSVDAYSLDDAFDALAVGFSDEELADTTVVKWLD